MIVSKTLALVLKLETALSIDYAFSAAGNLDTHTVLRQIVLVLFCVDGIDTVLVYHGIVLQHLAQTVDNLSVVGRLCQQVVADGTGGNVKVGKNCSLLIFLGSEGEVTLGVHEAHHTGQLAGEAHGVVVVLQSLVAGHEE